MKFSESAWWFTKRKIVYGLDIQGGLQLVMGVDVQSVVAQNSKNIVASMPQEFKDEKKMDLAGYK